MEHDLYNALQIKYIKLYITIEFLDEYHLPEHKESAIRGGLGEMLLRANCIKDRNCEKCEYYDECVVRRTMYSFYKIKPPFVTSGDSIGYVIYCNDRRTKVENGDKLRFELILFGNCLVYFNLYVQALFALGMNGIGKDYAKFVICTIQNSSKENILVDQQLYMKYYQPETVYDYVKKRYDSIDTDCMKLKFVTPLTLKYKNEFLKAFDMEAIIKSIKRRIYMMNCYIGEDVADWYKKEEFIPLISKQFVYHNSVKRFSSTQNSTMILKGITGGIEIENLTEDTFNILLAGELIHIGKNTSFGFGKYYCKFISVGT